MAVNKLLVPESARAREYAELKAQLRQRLSELKKQRLHKRQQHRKQFDAKRPASEEQQLTPLEAERAQSRRARLVAKRAQEDATTVGDIDYDAAAILKICTARARQHYEAQLKSLALKFNVTCIGQDELRLAILCSGIRGTLDCFAVPSTKHNHYPTHNRSPCSMIDKAYSLDFYNDAEKCCSLNGPRNTTAASLPSPAHLLVKPPQFAWTVPLYRNISVN